MNKSLNQLVESLYQTGLTNEYEVTEALFEELEGRAWEEVHSMLYNLVRDGVRSELRNIISRNHHRSKDAEMERRSAGEVTIRRQAVKTPDITSILDLDVVTGDGVRKYGALTIKEHVQQISTHLGARAAADQSIRSHQWACGAITKHNVTCLNDIDPKVLTSELPYGGVKL